MLRLCRLLPCFRRSFSSQGAASMIDQRTSGNVSVIKLQNPPMNAFRHEVRAGLVEGIKKANEDASVKSIVIHGDGNVFSAGADITEFASGGNALEPGLISVVHHIENSAKPVVAAIHGLAFGGGLEVCLGSHYRVMHSKARIAFPEVNIGILPAATGSQRLPRVTDIATAVEMCTTGMPVSAKKALEKGIVDKVVDGDVVSEAINFARSIEDEPVEPRRVSKMRVKANEFTSAVFDAAYDMIAKRARGAAAPVFNVKAIEAAVNSKSYEEGLEREHGLALPLFVGSQARALQYAFFSERKLPKWEIPGGAVNYKNSTPIEIKEGAVIGGGTMGSGIAICFITSGIPVKLVEVNQEYLDKTLSTIRKVINTKVEKGRLSPEKADQQLSLLQGTLNYNDLKNADIVIEAVFENLELKKKIFKKLDETCKPETVLASNTSGLDIDQVMAAVTSRPGKVVGTHFFSPAHVMKLLENIRGKDTSPETMATVMDLGKKLKKVSVLVGNCPHFVGNRMLGPYGTEASYLLEEGALPHEVDQVLEDFGFPMGVFRVSDLAGIDVGYKSRKDFGLITREGQDDRFRNGRRYCPVADFLVERGRLGQKSGKGWYNYGKVGGRNPQPDPEVEQLILEMSEKAGFKRRRITPLEILERCLYSMINEGFKILEEGIASRQEDIDMVWLYGYGWPRHTGGPMYYARNQVGLGRIYERLLYYQALNPDVPHWEPSGLLRDEGMAKLFRSSKL
ncbi:Peroxisomal bifunctional enzyme [Holothuria leucospilota]|uniref:Peroxisomal bifunctional enzyme n=1 Tax=Holothuria leucospilota TaxID=206669 RepID=A0A9Q1BHD4_HOLLE|nr:Peroxisomal bifunctional enzyme [Holothuria leucospilota]